VQLAVTPGEGAAERLATTRPGGALLVASVIACELLTPVTAHVAVAVCVPMDAPEQSAEDPK
jgi:hypothetical protein